jgi:hypothetical protein
MCLPQETPAMFTDLIFNPFSDNNEKVVHDRYCHPKSFRIGDLLKNDPPRSVLCFFEVVYSMSKNSKFHYITSALLLYIYVIPNFCNGRF